MSGVGSLIASVPEKLRDMILVSPIRAFFVNPCWFINPIFCCSCLTPFGAMAASAQIIWYQTQSSFWYGVQVVIESVSLLQGDFACFICPSFVPNMLSIKPEAWVLYGSCFMAMFGSCVASFKVGEDSGARMAAAAGPMSFARPEKKGFTLDIVEEEEEDPMVLYLGGAFVVALIFTVYTAMAKDDKKEYGVGYDGSYDDASEEEEILMK